MKSVLLIDEHVMFREGLGLLLGQRLGPIRLLEAGSLHLGMRLLAAQDRPVDLVLLDLELRDSRGLSTFERLRQSCPQLPVLVLSGSIDDMPAAELIERGAAGFVPKSLGIDALVEPVRRLLQSAAPAEPEPLSPRQRAVLGLLVEGKSNKLISRELDLSEATVKTHLQAIFRKLDVCNRTQAVLAAVRLGLVDEHEAERFRTMTHD